MADTKINIKKLTHLFNSLSYIPYLPVFYFRLLILRGECERDAIALTNLLPLNCLC